MKNKLFLSISIISVFLLIDHQLDVLRFLQVELPRGIGRFFIYHGSSLGLVLLVTSILFGAKPALSPLGMDKGVLKGLGYGFFFTLPMFLGYALTGQWQNGNSLWSVGMIFIAAAMEEVVYRGFLFGLLFRKAGWGFIPAVVLNALIFGLAHLYQGETLGQTLGIFAVTLVGGIWFAWLYIEWDNNLWLPIFLHFFMNLSWSLFAVDDNALGGWSANLFRMMTIALSVVFTILYSHQRKLKHIDRRNLWRNT